MFKVNNNDTRNGVILVPLLLTLNSVLLFTLNMQLSSEKFQILDQNKQVVLINYSWLCLLLCIVWIYSCIKWTMLNWYLLTICTNRRPWSFPCCVVCSFIKHNVPLFVNNISMFSYVFFNDPFQFFRRLSLY